MFDVIGSLYALQYLIHSTFILVVVYLEVDIKYNDVTHRFVVFTSFFTFICTT